MRIVAGVPLIVQPDGLKERTDACLDTETLLYFEQQLDRGDGIIEPIPQREEPASKEYTHRFISETGGWFHVKVEAGDPVSLPRLGLPFHLETILETAGELREMVRRQQTLLAANGLLEVRCKQLELEALSLRDQVSSLEIANEQLERHLSPSM